MGSAETPEQFMRRALQLARRGVGKTSPNPAVGCVIVRDGRIVGEGWHRKAGTPHAEVHALRQAGELARGADLYVTLEPCSHHGRTPPCSEAVAAAGVARVFAGMTDPNPLVAGRGLQFLRDAGIAVSTGLLESDCRAVNPAFIKHITTGIPFVSCKSAMTLDGKTATVSGDSKWITGQEARAYGHRLRARHDAIVVGIETVLLDDPELTVRHVRGRNPVRVVVDSRLRITECRKLLSLPLAAGTVVATVTTGARVAELEATGARVLLCNERDGRVDVEDLLLRLGQEKIQSVLVEGGGTLAGEFLRRRLVDRFYLFLAPRLLGGEGRSAFAGPPPATIADSVGLKQVSVKRLGHDLLIECSPEDTCLPA